MGTLASARKRRGPPTDRLVTGEELLEHPEWGRCELIRGRVILMSPAGGPHGMLSGIIHGETYLHAKAKDLGLVLSAETGVYLELDPDTVRAPDVMFIRRERIPKEGIAEGYLNFAPDLCVEVVSPSDKFQEVVEKAGMYLKAGVKTVWIVECRSKTVHIYKQGNPVVLHEGDTLKDEEILPGFALPLKKVFV